MTAQPFALVSFAVVVPLVAALIAGFFTWIATARQYRREDRDKATQALRRYRDPLLRASFDLQSRLYNLVARGFLSRYWVNGSDEQRGYAHWSTLWLFGQYLGWVEILRREVQYLDLGSKAKNRRLQRQLNEVSAAIASDATGQNDLLIIYRSDQRAIGESMVVYRSEQPGNGIDCMGYSEFRDAYASPRDLEPDARNSDVRGEMIRSWAERFAQDLDLLAEKTEAGALPTRVVNIQRRLIDLLDLLDPDRLRYPHLDYRGRLPGPKGPQERLDSVARFIWPWGDPWQRVVPWAADQSMALHEVDDDGVRTYRGRRGLLGRRLEVRLAYDEAKWLSVGAGTARFGKMRAIDGSLRNRRARGQLNPLLLAFDRPTTRGSETLADRLVQLILSQLRRLRPGAAGHEN